MDEIFRQVAAAHGLEVGPVAAVVTRFLAEVGMCLRAEPRQLELPTLGILTSALVDKMQTAARTTFELAAGEVGEIRYAIRRGEPIDVVAARLRRPLAVAAAFLDLPAADDPRQGIDLEAAARFWQHVNRNPTPDGCLLWRGRTEYGWGRFHHDGFYHQAHRVAYQLRFQDALPSHYRLVHTCGNYCCVAVDHLKVVRSFPAAAGDDHGLAKLTDGDVRAIREALAGAVRDDDAGLEVTFAGLAKRYHVDESTLRKVASGMRRWGAGGPLMTVDGAVTNDWQHSFLAALRDGFSDEQAAAIAGVDIQHCRVERNANRVFASAWLWYGQQADKECQ